MMTMDKDQGLYFKILPASLLITGFVNGNPNSSEEKYLLEFVNASRYFRQKSNGEIFCSPPGQSNGECDCISKSYKLDFKLLISSSLAKAKNLFSRSITQPLPCVTAYGEPKKSLGDKDYNPISATFLHTWLREISNDELWDISLSNDESEPAYKDIHFILKAINKPKNLLCMLPYEYYYNANMEYSFQEERVINTIIGDFNSIAQYRKRAQPDYETYIAFVFWNNFFILNCSKTDVVVVDKLPTNSSKTFQYLYNISK